MSRILIVTPAGQGSLRGNRVTAERYAGLLRAAGHDVEVTTEFADQACDVVFALHARRSAAAVREARGRAPIVVVLTGTDLYGDVPAGDADALASLDAADRLVVLHPRGAHDLPASVRDKALPILQSVDEVFAAIPQHDGSAFVGCVLGHLREAKDPIRAALAARALPASSRIRIVQVGDVLEAAAGEAARAEQATNPRYRWLGPRPRAEALGILAGCDLHLLTSVMEGGANVLCEAIAHGVPSLASDIPSTRAIVGDDYPGLFPVGDTAALTQLLVRAEDNPRSDASSSTPRSRNDETSHPRTSERPWRR